MLTEQRKKTEKILTDLEKEIYQNYAQAQSQIDDRLNQYLEQFNKDDKIMRLRLARGEITQAEYNKWRENKIVATKAWRRVKTQLASDYTEIAKLSAKAMRSSCIDAYMINWNYEVFGVAKDVGLDLGARMYDRQAVLNLLKRNPTLLPQPSVKTAITNAYNARLIQGEILKGIIHGDSIPKIAKSLKKVTGMNNLSAVRNARTAITTAENTARQKAWEASNHKLEKYGIKEKKEWVATLDARTRPDHQHADGQIVDIDKPFVVGGYSMMCPGDNNAPASEVYNCRCTMNKIKVGRGNDTYRRAKENGKNVIAPNMTYDEWAKARGGNA